MWKKAKVCSWGVALELVAISIKSLPPPPPVEATPVEAAPVEAPAQKIPPKPEITEKVKRELEVEQLSILEDDLDALLTTSITPSTTLSPSVPLNVSGMISSGDPVLVDSKQVPQLESWLDDVLSF